MISDLELRQTLGLLSTQKSWIYREISDQDEMQVIRLASVPKESGICWVAGTTELRCGRHVESVFRADTDAGGEFVTVFWSIEGQWYHHDDTDALTSLGMTKNEVFPFDWSFAVPLEHDVFHPTE